MNDILFEVIKLLLTILIALIGRYAVPYLREKLGTAKLDRIYHWADLAVRWAEQVITEKGQGEKKKAMVVAFLKKLLDKNHVKITEEQLEVLIEAIVRQMNSEDIEISVQEVDDEL